MIDHGQRLSKISSLLSLLLFFLVSEAISIEPASPLPNVQTYDQLLSAIRQVKAESRTRLEQFAEQERVREAWETGKLIDEHVLHHKERAEYGAQVIKRLSSDLGISYTELKYMREFARAYPTGRTSGQLSWSHIEALLAINDAEERAEVEKTAQKEKWPVAKLRNEIKKRKLRVSELLEEKPLEAEPGQLAAYRMVNAPEGPYAGELALDLGFSNWYKPEKGLKGAEGTIVKVEGKTGKKMKFKTCPECQKSDLYTYHAYVKEVLDGDTLNAVIDLGFGFTTYQTLRLRAIDAPEIETAEGKEAKEYLEKILRGTKGRKDERTPSDVRLSALLRRSEVEASQRREAKDKEDRPLVLSSSHPIVIRTVKSDKYDRYLADVFVDGKYVNQKLVEEGLAVVVED